MEDIDVLGKNKRLAIRNIATFFSVARMQGREQEIEQWLPRHGLPAYPERAQNGTPRGCRI